MPAKPAQVKGLLDAAERAAKAHAALHGKARKLRARERLPKRESREYNAAVRQLWEACYEVAGIEPPDFGSIGLG